MIRNLQVHGGEITEPSPDGSIVMVDQILRRLPIDVRDLMGPDEVKKATVRARKQAATVRYAGNGAWGEVRLNETTCKVVTRV